MFLAKNFMYMYKCSMYEPNWSKTHMGCSVVVLCKILLKVVPSTLYYYIVLVFFQVTAGYKSCFSKS